MTFFDKLVGKPAGKIAMSNYPIDDPGLDILTDPAAHLQNVLMSAWTLLEVWGDDTSVWLSPDEERRAIVSPIRKYALR